jgi:flagellin-like protein
MEVRELLTDDSAVSPVIGVILMVAITVILAAVIAAFVLGLGDTSNPGPQVSFDYDYDSSAQTLDVTVQSGDQFEASQVSFSGDFTADSGEGTWADESGADGDSLIGAGDSATGIDVDDDAFELDIVWESSDGSDSQVISSTSGPDA